MENETVTISLEEYNKLKRNAAWLESLNWAGVDNWDGIDYAYELFHENHPEYNED